MTTPINDGGPAFPRPSGPAQEDINTSAHEGMTLRDWFAGQALAGMAASNYYQNVVRNSNDNTLRGSIARFAYSLADDMIAERIKS